MCQTCQIPRTSRARMLPMPETTMPPAALRVGTVRAHPLFMAGAGRGTLEPTTPS